MTLDDIIACLRHAGHKVTPQRMAITRTVLKSTEHLTPPALYEKVHRRHPEIGEVTVYRTLAILEKLGLVCMVHTGDNAHGYISRPPGHHDHLICLECGRVINFTKCNVASLEKRLAAETGFTIDEHRLDVYGLCPGCGKKQTARGKA